MNKQYRYCFKTKKLVEKSDGDEHIPPKKTENNIERVIVDGTNVRVVSKTASIYKEFDDFFTGIPTMLNSLQLPQSKYKEVVEMMKGFVSRTHDLCTKLNESDGNVCQSSAADTSTKYSLDKLKSIDSTFKLKSFIRKNPFYVAPEEVAIGLRWKKPQVNEETQIPDHQMKESTFQFVSPIKSLEAMFLDPDFTKCYINYNLNEKHKCVDGVYKDFCCGSVCRSKEIFDNPLSLKIQLGSDDFEVCCALKSKSNIHKTCATYMQILNMPAEYRSKNNSMQLVALCNSAYLKKDGTSYNYIAQKIVAEVRQLEQTGILVDGHVIKGSIINVSCDNLGANSTFGFTESFNGTHYCRHCECTSTECRKQTKEQRHKLRTKRSYESLVDVAEGLDKMDLKKTKGIKRLCVFNELAYYHTIDNVCVDLMHDFNEGVILYCLHDFFSHIISNKTLTVGEIQQRVRDFGYSQTHKYNTPSLINLDKHNLNQSASQIYTLMIHIPFIFNDILAKCDQFWLPVQSLLECMQIVYSQSITESDIKTLKEKVTVHLKSVQEVNKRECTPKHHFLTHYPGNIEKMGPPINLWTMRMEAKHKVFTEILKRKKNFINPAKTMAENHQKTSCNAPVCNVDTTASLRSGEFAKTLQYSKFKDILIKEFGAEHATQLRNHKFANYCDIQYREGNFIVVNRNLCRIVHIISDGSKVKFICQPFEIVRKDISRVSVVVEISDQNAFILDVKHLENKLVCFHIFVSNEYHIIANKLFVASLLD